MGEQVSITYNYPTLGRFHTTLSGLPGFCPVKVRDWLFGGKSGSVNRLLFWISSAFSVLKSFFVSAIFQTLLLLYFPWTQWITATGLLPSRNEELILFLPCSCWVSCRNLLNVGHVDVNYCFFFRDMITFIYILSVITRSSVASCIARLWRQIIMSDMHSRH